MAFSVAVSIHMKAELKFSNCPHESASTGTHTHTNTHTHTTPTYTLFLVCVCAARKSGRCGPSQWCGHGSCGDGRFRLGT